jgi:hypothetical protein
VGHPAAPASHNAPLQRQATLAPPEQRLAYAVEEPPPAPEPPNVARTAADSAEVASAPVTSFVVQRQDTGGAAAAGPADAGSPGGGGAPPGGGGDLDELSRKIYDRILDRLKAELYLDRERAGLLSDLTA